MYFLPLGLELVVIPTVGPTDVDGSDVGGIRDGTVFVGLVVIGSVFVGSVFVGMKVPGPTPLGRAGTIRVSTRNLGLGCGFQTAGSADVPISGPGACGCTLPSSFSFFASAFVIGVSIFFWV